MSTSVENQPPTYQIIFTGAAALFGAAAVISHVRADSGGCGIPILGRYTPADFSVLLICILLCAVFGFAAFFLSAKKQKLFLIQSGMVVFGLVLGAVLFEAYLRLSEPRQSIRESTYVSHEVIGKTYRPNSEVQGIPVDSRGFLIHQPNHDNPPEGARRVVMLGDSFVAGVEVAPEDNMSIVLQDRLNQSNLPDRYHVLNLGMQGTEPARYRVIFREIGLDYKPDIVVVVVYVLNDFFGDAALYRDSRIELDDSGDVVRFASDVDEESLTFWTAETGLQLVDVRESRPKLSLRTAEFIQEEVYLPYCTARQEEGRKEGDIGLNTTFSNDFEMRETTSVESMLIGIYKDEYTPEDMAQINRTLQYLAFIQEDAADIGAETIIVILPPKEQINLDDPDAPADIPSTQPQDLLKDFCQEQGMTCVDLLPALREGAKESSPYLTGNIHFNEYGHAIAAEEIEKAIIALETDD